MILDALVSPAFSPEFSARLQTALDFLRTTDFSQTEAGRHELSDGLYYLVQRYATKDRCDAKFEAHRRCADMQYIVSGHEQIGWAPLADAQELSPFCAEKDSGKYTVSAAGAEFTVGPGQFAVFLPQDAHQPSFHKENEPPCDVVKVVVKIPLDK